MATLTLGEAESLVARALIRCRTSEANAICVARALVAAEADGLKGHGLSRTPSYAAQAKVGKVDGFAVPKVERARPGAAAIDAANGFAFPAIGAARALLPAMAREAGVASAAIRRSHHCGAAGHPVERLAGQGLVALMFANTPAAIAPWGGAKAVFGTNPIAFACPLPDRPPLGDAKGTPLALMVELLAAGLTGANFAAEASSFLDAEGPPPGTGQLIIALDPAAFGGSTEHFATLIASIEAQPGTRLPGSRRLAARRNAANDGLVLGDTLLTEIESL